MCDVCDFCCKVNSWSILKIYVTGPILESKESVRYVQKVYPTLVTKLT